LTAVTGQAALVGPMAHETTERAPGDELSRSLHGLNNALHGMSLRLFLLRNDPETMAKHAATVEALRRAIRAASDEIDRLEALLGERKEP